MWPARIGSGASVGRLERTTVSSPGDGWAQAGAAVTRHSTSREVRVERRIPVSFHRLASHGGGSITDSPRLRLRLALRPPDVLRPAPPPRTGPAPGPAPAPGHPPPGCRAGAHAGARGPG